MQDRVPRYPGRVTLTPVSGQANTYDMVRADQPTQAGDALNKANLLPDDVATAIGLTQQNPQVKDALLKLNMRDKVGNILTSARKDFLDLVPSKYIRCAGQLYPSSTYPQLSSAVILSAGISWSKTSSTAVSGIAQTNTGRLVGLNASDALLYSDNGGISWGSLSAPITSITAVAFFEPDVLLIGTMNGEVHRSTNNGASWSAVSGSVPLRIAGFYRLSNGRILTRTRNGNFNATYGISYSDDLGKTWTRASTKGDFVSIVETPSGVIASINYDLSGTGTYKSTDFGVTWSKIDSSPQSSQMVISKQTGVVYAVRASDTDALYYSKNDGVSWNTVKVSPTSGKYVFDVMTHDSGAVIVVTADGVYVSFENEPSFSKFYSGTFSRTYYRSSVFEQLSDKSVLLGDPTSTSLFKSDASSIYIPNIPNFYIKVAE